MAVRPLMSWSSPVGPLALIALPVVLVLAAGGLVLYKRRRL
jgi:LPXTG-motif cell wall-anchored protein